MAIGEIILWVLLAGVVAAAGFVLLGVRRRNMHLWLGAFVRQRRRDAKRHADGPVHVLLCIADHFEPSWGGASEEEADQRVAAWLREYPFALGGFKDSDGRAPRHTFFYPIDEYHEGHVGAIAELCRQGYGELEVHLHHDRDTAENLARTLERFTRLFSERHGALGRWKDGRLAFGFVHGNWALDNSRPDGRWCGVRNELQVLRDAGCYADFTMPSAPDATQTRKINSIYYAVGRDGCCKSHDRGVDVGKGAAPENGLMMIQGPLGLWRRRGSVRPRIENGCVQRGQAATMERLEHWIRWGPRVSGRPDWVFVKLHTHGAKAENREALLGSAGVAFHRALAKRAEADSSFRYHYVTAREMYNLARAAEAGWSGSVMAGLDYEVRAVGPNNVERRIAKAE